MRNKQKFRDLKKMTTSIAALALVAIFFALTSTGCENEGKKHSEDHTLLGAILGMMTDQPELSAPNTGTFAITFHDKPMAGSKIRNVNMKILRTEIIDADNNATVISNRPRSFDLLQLTAENPITLAHARVPAGTYKQVKLILDGAASVTLKDGSVQPLVMAGGLQNEISISGTFTVPEGLLYLLNIDLNPERSIASVAGGGYELNPKYELEGYVPLVGIYHYNGTPIKSASLILETRIDRTFRVKNSNSKNYDITGTFYYDSLQQRLLFYPRKLACPSCGWAPQPLSSATGIPFPSILVFRVNSFDEDESMNVKRIDKDTGLSMQFNGIKAYQFP